MRGFDVTTKGLDPLPLGLDLSCFIGISKDIMVESLTKLASNKPHLLEDMCSQNSLLPLNKHCLSPKREDWATFKEMSLP